mmetsp:Transcript_6992/g.11095  ORF Transcript_6992/g.11095 Transcript_6992/m.11095 type:complete len:226 (+) Transcript_6992:386-1063(+)
MSASRSKRRDMDIMKLMMSNYDVDMEGDGADFFVQFHGPKDTLYEGGIWKVQVTLPKDYPYRSPSIGFKNRMYHPNVDEMSGSVCLDVINQTWSPMYELLNIFDMFLPQLLSYPNASDPLNSEAAALMLQDMEKYKLKVKDYVNKYANGDTGKTRNMSTDSTVSDSSVSTCSSSASSCTDEPGSATTRDEEENDVEMADKLGGDDDDLSSLSDSSDTEDNLVLDL